MSSLWRRSAELSSSAEASLMKVQVPIGLGTAARSLPSRVLSMAAVPFSRISSLNCGWSIESPALEKRDRMRRCSSSVMSLRLLAKVAE